MTEIESLIEQKQWTQARESIHEGLEDAPTDHWLWLTLSLTYYDRVLKAVGNDKAANAIVLFMMPGMNHCRGGDGPDTFDQVKVIEQWVEQGSKPTQSVASHLTNGQVDKTRPICAYPQVAKYKGSGDINDAANFTCVVSGR